MNIPSRVNPFGYDNTIPPGFTRVDCLYKTGSTNFIEVGTFLCSGFEIDIKNDNFGVTRFIGGSCQSLVSGYGIRPFYLLGNNPDRLAFCQGGGYGYNVNNFSTFKRFTCKLTRSEVLLDGEEQTSFTAYTDTEPYADVQPVYIGKVAASGAGRAYYYTVKIWDDTENLRHSFIPVLDATGIPCMFDLVTNNPFYNSGTGQFTVGLTTKQAIDLAHLPVPTTINTMTISLPLEAAFDANVESALEAAADKGWTITVQYRESELTTKNIPADFLESTGTQYIRTQVSLSSEAKVEVETEDFENRPESGAFGTEHTNDSYSPLNTTNRFNFFRFRGPARSDYGSDAKTLSKWWPSFKRVHVVKDKNKSYVDGVLYYEHEKTTFDGIPAFLFSLGNNPAYYYTGRIFWIKMGNNGVVEFSGLPTLDSTGTPCMYDTVSGQNFYNVGTGAFTVGFDTTEKAAISISKLPLTTDGTLTVSLPAAAQNTDTLVPAAIDIATNRGWTIITQYRED